MKTLLETATLTKKAINGLEDIFSKQHQEAHANGIDWDTFYDLPTTKEVTSLQSQLENEFRYLEKREIKAYANNSGYSDVEPWEVIRVVSDKCVEIRKMTTKQTKFPSDFHAGGFVGHFADNRSGQDYEYISDENNVTMKIRWSEANRQWQNGKYNRFHMSDAPYKFYDYNF